MTVCKGNNVIFQQHLRILRPLESRIRALESRLQNFPGYLDNQRARTRKTKRLSVIQVLTQKRDRTLKRKSFDDSFDDSDEEFCSDEEEYDYENLIESELVWNTLVDSLEELNAVYDLTQIKIQFNKVFDALIEVSCLDEDEGPRISLPLWRLSETCAFKIGIQASLDEIEEEEPNKSLWLQQMPKRELYAFCVLGSLVGFIYNKRRTSELMLPYLIIISIERRLTQVTRLLIEIYFETYSIDDFFKDRFACDFCYADSLLDYDIVANAVNSTLLRKLKTSSTTISEKLYIKQLSCFTTGVDDDWKRFQFVKAFFKNNELEAFKVFLRLYVEPWTNSALIKQFLSLECKDDSLRAIMYLSLYAYFGIERRTLFKLTQQQLHNTAETLKNLEEMWFMHRLFKKLISRSNNTQIVKFMLHAAELSGRKRWTKPLKLRLYQLRGKTGGIIQS